MLAGQAGSAETVFAGQFLAEGVRRGQPGVFVTLEEPADDLRSELTTLGWDTDGWEAARAWESVDPSPLVRRGGSAGWSASCALATLPSQPDDGFPLG